MTLHSSIHMYSSLPTPQGVSVCVCVCVYLEVALADVVEPPVAVAEACVAPPHSIAPESYKHHVFQQLGGGGGGGHSLPYSANTT